MSSTQTLLSDQLCIPHTFKNTKNPNSSYNRSKSTNSFEEGARSAYQRNVSFYIPGKAKPITKKRTTSPNNSQLTEDSKRLFSNCRMSVNQYQNEILEAESLIKSLTAENRALKTEQKRQEVALSKYQNANAELPKMFDSHAEEIRVWEIKYRNLTNVHEDLTERLTKKHLIMQAVSDQNIYYTQLNKTKNLEQRYKLTEQLEALETKIKEKDEEMKKGVWRLQAEIRYVKQLLSREQIKDKDYILKLEKSRSKLDTFKKLDEVLNEKNYADKKQLPCIKEKAELTEHSTTTDTDTFFYSDKKQIRKSPLQNSKLARKAVVEKKIHFQHQNRQQFKVSAEERGSHDASSMVEDVFQREEHIEEQPSESNLSADMYSLKCSEDEQQEQNEITNGEFPSNLEAVTTDYSVTEDSDKKINKSKTDCFQLTKEIDELQLKLNKENLDWTINFDKYATEAKKLFCSSDDEQTRQIEEMNNKPVLDSLYNTKYNKMLASLKTDIHFITQ